MKQLLITFGMFAIFQADCRKKQTDASKASQQYISLLKADQYPKYDPIPRLGRDDIPYLIRYVSDSQVIHNFPIPLVSAYAWGPQQLGMVVMYTIESIRLQREYGVSSCPYIVDSMDRQRPLDVKLPAQLYMNWWEKNQDKGIDELKKLSPLEGTRMSW